MAALTPPSIQKGVYNRLPFVTKSDSNDDLINDFTADFFSELQNGLSKANDKYMDEDNYSNAERSLFSDLVACKLLVRRAVQNMEGGDGVVAGEAIKGLKKAKAGEAEAEFNYSTAKDGSTILIEGGNLVNRLMADAVRKAHNLGIVIDLSYETEFTISIMTTTSKAIFNISFNDC